MKKVFNTMIMVVITVLGATAMSSFTSTMPNKTEINTVAKAQPVYWSGTVYGASSYLKIKVYQQPNSCNSFYAEITGGGSANAWFKEKWIGKTVTVRDSGDKKKPYLITWEGSTFHFSM